MADPPLSDTEALLAQMGTLSAGKALGTLVSIDAVLVLSGAVLTSYVGVTGYHSYLKGIRDGFPQMYGVSRG